MGMAFLLLYLLDRTRTAALRLSGAYLLTAMGYTQILLVGGDLRQASPLVTMLSIFGGYLLLLGAVSRLCDRAVPLRAFLLPAGIAVAVILATLAEPTLLWLRVSAAYGFMAIINLICGLILWRQSSRRIDTAIAGIFFVQVAVILGQISRMYLPGAEPLEMASFGASHFSITLRTANALFGIVLGIALFVRFSVVEVERLTRLAGTDPLTGLLNRRAFETAAEALRSASAPLPTGLIICDIDHFKRVNDCHGHEAGDRALKAFARLLVRETPETAICTRLGGEEFCILLSGSSSETTHLVATRLRVAVERLRIATEPGRLKLTASFGYCELAPAQDLRAAMAKVDAAVYQAKNDGRNRVRMAA